jgi:CRISPR-associated protein Csb2
MFAVELELLTGRYVATAYNDRERAEWPPHPARLFSALVDTWASGEVMSGDGEQERMALLWLERQPPPSLVASGTNEIGHRDAAPTFVPVNDISVVRDPDAAREKLREAELATADSSDGKAVAKAQKAVDKARKKLRDDTAKAIAAPSAFSVSDLGAAALLFPEARLKQPRTFPSVTPANDRVTFVWQDDPEAPLDAALERLLARLTRLGHSSSLVAARRVHASARPRFSPASDGELMLRAVAPGQLDRLIAAHHLHQGVESRVLPCAFVRYREGDGDERALLERSVFADQWVIFARAGGPRLPSTSAVGVARMFRRAVLAAGGAPMSEALSGHREDGGSALQSHVAVVPLPDVGSQHARGGLLGVALVLPRALSKDDRTTLLRAVGQLEQRLWRDREDRERRHTDLPTDVERAALLELGSAPAIELLLGDAGVLRLERVVWGEHKTQGLRAVTWCRRSRCWATATPIALDQNPGDLHASDAAKREHAFERATELVHQAVERIGLPRPAYVNVSRSCVLPGTDKPNRFPRFPVARERPQRVLVHARLTFARPVQGPLLLGAGRFFGLGLCRPVSAHQEVSDDAADV